VRDKLNYKILQKVFCITFILYIFSSCSVFATSLFKEGGECGKRNCEYLETCGVNRKGDDEYIDFNPSDDTIWFSVMAASSPPALEVDVTTLDFGETETSKEFSITNSGDDTLMWSLYEDEEWITVDTTTGNLEATMSTLVTVEVDRSKVLTIGVIDSTVTITSNGGNAEIEVTMTVSEQPVLEVSPSALDFCEAYVVKELFIRNSGNGVLDWLISAQEAWITVDQETGSTDEGKTDMVNIMVDRSAVTVLGRYSDELSITSDGGDVIVSVVMEKVNHPPEIPAAISPVDGALNQSLYTTLSWQGGDLDIGDGDLVTYDVYFSANESLVDVEDISVLTCSNMEICYCDPGTNTLESDTTYYWKVIAKDSYGKMSPSSVWSFTTEDDAISLCPAFALELGYEERYLLRELRDKVLAKDEDGRNCIKLYYRYSWELLLILFINDELRMKSMEVFKELLPAIRGLLANRETVVTVKTTKEIRELLGKIELHASPQLKKILKKVQADIKNREKLKTFGIIVK